jgi:hypothetical protein
MFNLGGLMAVIIIFVMIAPMVLAFAKSWWTPRILCVLISGEVPASTLFASSHCRSFCGSEQ